MLDKVVQFFQWAKGVYEGSKVLQAITTIVNVATLVVGVKGFIQARNMLAKGQDILANKTSAGGKIPVIYGTRRVGAQIIYMDVNANDSKDLYVVYALAVGEVDEIIGKSIELDGNRLTDSARFRDGGYIGTDKISSGNYSLNTVSQNGTGIDAGAGQFGSSPTSKYRYVMNLHHGAATQTADPMLVASMPNWTSAHKLNGIAYIAAHYGYDKEGIWSGVPQLTVQVRGKKVYDPRLDSTAGGSGSQRFNDVSTYAYSDNPALCFLNYITDNEVGKGLTESQINMSTFSSAANVCDTEVDNPFFGGTSKSLTWSGVAGDSFITIGGSDPNSDWWQNKIGELIDIYDNNGDGVITGKEITDIQRDEFFDQNPLYRVYFNDTLGTNYSTQSTGSSLAKIKRFHCNGYLDTNKNVMENAKELLANMRGIFLYIDGKYELQIEDTGTSTFTITDDHIIADAGISVDYGNKDKKANKVIVEFFNANKKYELDTATVLHDATPEYYSDDGDEILEIKAEFPYVTDPYIAYNMAKAILVRSRKQMTIQFLGTPEMYKLNVGDIVTLNYVGTFDTSQTCRVEALELQPNGLVAVSLIEYFDVYTWQSPPEEPLEELANLPSAYAVKAPTNITFTDTDSSSTGRPFLSWDEPTDFPDYQYRVNVVDSSSNQVKNTIVDVTNCDLNFLPTGSYVANITSLNTLGTESSPARFPTTGTFTIGDAPTGTPDIKNDAITTPKILDGNVTDAKINSITANKITAGTIDASVITVTNLDADNITSGTIGADKIDVTNLSAISADLGSITAGDMNIGSGNFTVSSAGVMTATGATISGEISATTGSIGGFSVGTTSLTAGSGSSRISLSTADGIHLGDNTFSSAPFRVALDGSVTATNATITGALTLTNIDGVTVTYTAGSLTVGTIGASNLGNDAIFPATLRYERTNSISAPSDSEFNTAFGRNPKNNDIVVVVRTDTNAQEAYKHNGTSFAVVNNYIDGDLIVDGTISTDQIATNAVTANEILVTNLAAISANMGSITSGSLDIGSGTFTVDTSGNMVATSATITGAITATSGTFAGSLSSADGTFTGTLSGVDGTFSGSLSSASGTFTGALSGGTISIGSGNSIFKADSNGIYLGNATFGSAPFRVTPTGALTATNATITGDVTATSGTFTGDIVANNLNITSATVTGSLSADNIQIDNVTIDTDGSGNLIIKSDGVGTTQIADNAVTNDKVNSISATKITADQLDSARINVDTLNVKSFDNVSSTIVSHVTAGTKFPLARDGQAYVQRTSPYTGSNASFVPVTITQVRDNAGYVAIFSGVLGDVSGGRVQYSLNNSTWVNANGNTNISWSAGTYRGYTYVYTGQITTLSASQSTVYWRVYFSGSYNHTQLSLNVMMDNTR